MAVFFSISLRYFISSKRSAYIKNDYWKPLILSQERIYLARIYGELVYDCNSILSWVIRRVKKKKLLLLIHVFLLQRKKGLIITILLPIMKLSYFQRACTQMAIKMYIFLLKVNIKVSLAFIVFIMVLWGRKSCLFINGFKLSET